MHIYIFICIISYILYVYVTIASYATTVATYNMSKYLRIKLDIISLVYSFNLCGNYCSFVINSGCINNHVVQLQVALLFCVT